MAQSPACFPAQSSVALNQRETIVSGQTCEQSRIEILIA
jgi:hypothetical protein